MMNEGNKWGLKPRAAVRAAGTAIDCRGCLPPWAGRGTYKSEGRPAVSSGAPHLTIDPCQAWGVGRKSRCIHWVSSWWPGIITRPKPAERREACWPRGRCTVFGCCAVVLHHQRSGTWTGACGDERLGRRRL